MIRYELLKIYKSWLLLILMVIATIFSIYVYLPRYSVNYSDAQALFSSIGSELTQENYNILKKANAEAQLKMGTSEKVYIEEIGESFYWYTIYGSYNQARYIIAQEHRKYEVLKLAEFNMNEYSPNNNYDSYQFKYSEKIYSTYYNRSDLRLLVQNGWIHFFESYSGSLQMHIFMLLAVFIILIGITNIFVRDYESGAYQIIYSSYLGRSSLFFSRLIASILFAVTIVAYFTLLIFVMYLYKYGLTDFLAPIQNISMFEHAPFNISILTTILIYMLYYIGVGILFAVVGALFGTIFKNKFLSLSLGIISFGSLYGLFMSVSYNNPMDLKSTMSYSQYQIENVLKIINPVHIFDINSYFIRFDVVNVLGFPVHRLTLYSLSTILLIFLLVVITWMVYCNKSFISIIRLRRR